MYSDHPQLCKLCSERLGLETEYKGRCELCGGILERTDLVDTINPDFEFGSFNVGVVLSPNIVEHESAIVSKFNLKSARSIKNEINTKTRKHLEEKLETPIDLINPDVVFEINYVKNRVFYRIKSLTILSRYLKFERGIPQTKWFCKSCRGKGCKKCGYTGKMYPISVEEIIAKPLLKATKGKISRFHGAGREDIDARMLGSGRPFVVEILSPKIRSIDLEQMAKEINMDKRIKVEKMKFCSKDVVEKIKNTKYKKTYVAYLDKNLTKTDISKIERELVGEIAQRTPIRVSHRRSDKIRKRKVYKVIVKDNKKTELEIYCDGGLYIKELISGDEGRTIPSVSSILKKKVSCKELDVIKIHSLDYLP
ncbi:MAG: tRNA pseudouridine(54/55) synthase Pus10 [Candidatus Methanofastidiosia archaeon]